MNLKKFISTLAVAGTMFSAFGLGVTSYYSNRTSNFNVNYTDASLSLSPRSRFNSINLVEPEEIDRGIFSIKVKSATSTPKAKSFEFSFESVQIKTFSSNTKSYFIAVDDESFTDASDYQKPAEGHEAPEFTAYVYHVEKGTITDGAVYLPATFKYGSKFVLDVYKIGTECCSTENDYVGITDIYIPSEIISIEKDAFINVPDTVTLHCEANEKLEGWDEDWTDAANIVYGASISQKNKAGAYTAGGDRSFGDAENFIVGSKTVPLLVKYVVNSNGEFVTREMELPVSSQLNDYDGVGSRLGSNVLTKIVDIEVKPGEEIDPEQFVFYNIFTAKVERDTGGKVTNIVRDENNNPIPDVQYKSLAVKSYIKEIYLSDIISFSFNKINTFAGYTTVSMNVNLVLPSKYSELMPTVYANNLKEIEDGKYRIRYAFYNLTSASYNLTYKDSNGEPVNKTLKIKTPISAFELKKDNGNIVSFLIKNSDVGDDFESKNLVSFDLIGASLNIHLWDTKNNNKLGRSEFCKRFGHITVMSETDNAKVHNINAFLVTFYAIFTVVYATLATGLYFYLKNKYKNDEFRRMKTKPFVKKSVLGFVGSAIIILATLFVILRCTALKDSVVVFNPADIFIVLAGLVSLIIIGYFIKFLVTVSKANKQRKTSIKLHLNEDVADDGTK